MASQSWIQCVNTAQVVGNSITTGGPTTILPTQALYTFPAGFFYYIGQKWRVKAHGVMSTAATPGTLTISLYFGTIIVATASGMALFNGTKTNVPWELELTGTVRAIGNGTSANNIYFGHFSSEGCLGSAVFGTAGQGAFLIPSNSPTTSAGWDSTASQLVDLKITWTQTVNSITLYEYALEALN
jgi:hypothetical protein